MKPRDAGQAAVEAALTLPIMVFLFLGTLQLFLCYQARLLATYAASRAVSAGSRNHGSCGSMNDAALASLLPAIESFAGNRHGGTVTENWADAYRERNQALPYAQYAAHDGAHAGSGIFWLIRELPLSESEEEFDLPSGADRTLTLRLVFWYPMQIPFANWVLSSMFRAQYGLQDYVASNPLISPQNAHWTRPPGTFSLDSAIASELQSRAASQQYVFPVTVGWAMRMMTPSRATARNCAPAPAGVL